MTCAPSPWPRNKLEAATWQLLPPPPSCMRTGQVVSAAQACRDHWQQGRQQCGEVSLTGQPCTRPPAQQHPGDPPEVRTAPDESASVAHDDTSRATSSAPDVAVPGGEASAESAEASTQCRAAAGVGHVHRSGVQYLLADASGLSRWAAFLQVASTSLHAQSSE